MRRAREVVAGALVAAALMGLPSCVMQQGHAVDLRPHEALTLGERLASRGDVIGAQHLWQRARRRAPWSTYAVLATLSAYENPLSAFVAPLMPLPATTIDDLDQAGKPDETDQTNDQVDDRIVD